MVKYKTVLMKYLEGKMRDSEEKVLAPVTSQIQKLSAEGYRFIGLYPVPIFVKSGCIGRLLGNPGENVTFFMMVFEKNA